MRVVHLQQLQALLLAQRQQLGQPPADPAGLIHQCRRGRCERRARLLDDVVQYRRQQRMLRTQFVIGILIAPTHIGNHQPVQLLRYIEVLEQCLGKKAVMEMLPLQAGDVPDTEADVSDLIANVGYRPVVPVEEGVARFVAWYRRMESGAEPRSQPVPPKERR